MVKFSIIIPIYNSSEFLSSCLDSVLNQTYPDFELICINDGSTDNSPKILNDYGSRFSNMRIINQENKGMSAARNAGIRLAEGEYVLFVDSDDLLSVDCLSVIAKNVNGEDLLCFNASVLKMPSGLTESEEGFDSSFSSGWDYYNRFALIPRKIHFVCVWQRAYRRDFLMDNSLLFNEQLKKAEDDLFTTLACYHAKSVKIIPDALYNYRLHEANISFSRNKKGLHDTIYVLNRLSSFFSDKQIPKLVLNKIIASGYINCFSKNIQRKYSVKDSEVVKLIDENSFAASCVAKRHKWLHFLIKINPSLFRFWNVLVSIIH